MARRLALLPLSVLAAGVLGLSACAAPSAPGADVETPSTSPSPTPSISASALPTATQTGTPSSDGQASASYTSCDEIITPAFAQDVTDNGWVGWNMAGQKMGHSPFDSFPGGAPDGQLSCRFGAGPEVATDNVLDLAWARIDESAAQAAQGALVDAGYERIDVSDGVQFGLRAEDGWADDEGWGATYHFAGDEVRWAVVRDQLSLLRPAT
ncbi:hypothetical protein [Microbacterium sp. LMI1-1-1.1]|uniref:hypothetical protein n=1 Tax=Microbacterium sp. LMI1-1-1.1 TaxID=3135223 RepID=UPI0034655A12